MSRAIRTTPRRRIAFVTWRGLPALSTDDYHHRPAEFLGWIARLESAGVQLWNPSPLLRWTLDKRYLGELGRCGVPVVPTLTVSRGSGTALADALASAGWDIGVVKPAVSASAHETWRSSRASASAELIEPTLFFRAEAAAAARFAEALRA